MAQVILKINGYSYTVGCADGQEERLTAMAQEVESRIDDIKKLGMQSGEGQLLALAGVMLADEVDDLRAEIEALKAAAAGPAKAAKKASGESAKKMAKLAARAEQIAAELDLPGNAG